MLLDGDSVAQADKAAMLPTVYVIGRDGRILHAERGYRENARENLAAMIAGWLAARRLASTCPFLSI